VSTFFVPGLRFFHEGQLEGRKARVSMHLQRRQVEAPDAELGAFYGRLLACLRRPDVREGSWRQIEPRPAWDGNPSAGQFVAGLWESGDRRTLTAVNYGPNQGQCYLPLDIPALAGAQVTLTDQLGDARYQRDGSALGSPGLYLDLPPWGRHVFDVQIR
jgi:hypothetical protein